MNGLTLRTKLSALNNALLKAFNSSQPRDERGRFAAGESHADVLARHERERSDLATKHSEIRQRISKLEQAKPRSSSVFDKPTPEVQEIRARRVAATAALYAQHRAEADAVNDNKQMDDSPFLTDDDEAILNGVWREIANEDVATPDGGDHADDLPVTEGDSEDKFKALALKSLTTDGQRRWYFANNPQFALAGNAPKLAEGGSKALHTQQLAEYVKSHDNAIAQHFYSGELTDFNGKARGESSAFSVNPEGVKAHAARFVQDARDATLPRYYHVDAHREEHGLTGSNQQVEAHLNRAKAAEAQAVLTAAHVGRVKLTDAQHNHLRNAAAGNYLDAKYSQYSSGDKGTLYKPSGRSRNSDGFVSAAAADLRSYAIERNNRSARAKAIAPSISITKASDGKRLMTILTSNAYRDRDNEFVSEKALQGYVEGAWDGEVCRADNPLLFWHKERDGSQQPIGQIVWADMEGAFLLEVAKEGDGQFTHKGESMPVSALWDYIEQNPDGITWGASHGFKPEAKESDPVTGAVTYHEITKVETSVLPLRRAANPYTNVEVSMSKERDSFLDNLFKKAGAAKAARDKAKTVQTKLDAEGVERKSITEKGIMDAAGVRIDALLAELFDNPPAGLREDVMDAIVDAITGDDDDDAEDMQGNGAEDSRQMLYGKEVSGVSVEFKEYVQKQADLIDELVQTQGEFARGFDSVVKGVQSVEARTAKMDERTAAFEKRLASMEKQLNGRPRLASKAVETEIDEESPIASTIKAQQTRAANSGMFPGLYKTGEN